MHGPSRGTPSAADSWTKLDQPHRGDAVLVAHSGPPSTAQNLHATPGKQNSRVRCKNRQAEQQSEVDYGQARRASKPHQDQPQQAAAFLMHQDTSLTTTIEHPPQGKRQGQPQQAAAYLTLPGGRRTAGQPQAPHSRPVVVTVRLPRSRASVRRPETSQQVPILT
ncbi:hypothetical protein Q5P01_023044 [Channa striata]|uniref:Uncharacterized protein n=1 Tax=Channa striata TaxID=64152 RepID=A0AA88LNN4_CHASR|nr:hypothetical protein Q5P01_023044 [Channa striata]